MGETKRFFEENMTVHERESKALGFGGLPISVEHESCNTFDHHFHAAYGFFLCLD